MTESDETGALRDARARYVEAVATLPALPKGRGKRRDALPFGGLCFGF